MADDTDATRRRWGLIALVGFAAAAVGVVGVRAAAAPSAVDGTLDVTAIESSAPVDRIEPLVVEPFAGADPARLPGEAAQRWVLELDGLEATDRTRLYVDGRRSVLALLDRSEPGDDGIGVVVAIDAETGEERWRAPFERGAGSLRLLGVLDDVAMIERLHPDDRGIVGFDVERGTVLWERPVTEPGLNRVLDGTSLVTRIGVSNDDGLVFIDPRSGDEVGQVDGELFSTDLLGRWFVRDGDAIVALDLRDGWQTPQQVATLTDSDVVVATVVGDRLIEADGTTLRVSDDAGGPRSEFVLRELGPVASIRGLFPIAGSAFVLTTEAETFGAVLADDGVELRWRVDGRVVNTIATDRGLALLTASAGGTDLRVVDASTGATITPVSLESTALRHAAHRRQRRRGRAAGRHRRRTRRSGSRR